MVVSDGEVVASRLRLDAQESKPLVLRDATESGRKEQSDISIVAVLEPNTNG